MTIWFSPNNWLALFAWMWAKNSSCNLKYFKTCFMRNMLVVLGCVILICGIILQFRVLSLFFFKLQEYFLEVECFIFVFFHCLGFLLWGVQLYICKNFSTFDLYCFSTVFLVLAYFVTLSYFHVFLWVLLPDMLSLPKGTLFSSLLSVLYWPPAPSMSHNHSLLELTEILFSCCPFLSQVGLLNLSTEWYFRISFLVSWLLTFWLCSWSIQKYALILSEISSLPWNFIPLPLPSLHGLIWIPSQQFFLSVEHFPQGTLDFCFRSSQDLDNELAF